MIRVASYNMRKAIGTDRRRKPERTIDVLNELGSDVIALQEADRRFGARASAIPLPLLDAHSDYKPVAFETPREGSIGWHGNAILVRKEAEVLDTSMLQIPSLEPRGAVLAEVRLGGETLRVVGMHLDLSGLWRRRQAAAILEAVNGRAPMPAVLMGDLNEWSLRGGCLKDFAAQCAFAECGKSFHVRRPVGRLDRIMVTGGLEVKACGVHESAKAKRASDHFPIWAELRRG
jgi:endonuclease/exonuclease/phosphatase family metal-dependent hydrolase